jgi:hypothetical protein
MRSIVVLVLMCLVPAVVAGQSPDRRVPPAPRRFSLVLELGGARGGPGAGLAEQMRKAGFDDTSPGGCFFGCIGPIDHPEQAGAGGATGLTARFAISDPVAVGAGYGHTSLGGSTGYRAKAGSEFGDYVFSSWEATMMWAGVFWRPGSDLRLGGGPGWYRLEDGEGFSVSRIGLMGEVGLEAPAARRFFLNLAIRGHLVPAKDVAQGWTVPITLRPKWSHVALLAGLGVRL